MMPSTAFEVVEISDRMRVMIRDGADEAEIVQAVRRDGAEPLMGNATGKLLTGKTTWEEVLRVIPATW